MHDTDHLVDRVEPDSNRTGAEKETSISMLGDAKQMRVMSAKPTIVRSLLKHDHFELSWATVEYDDDRGRKAFNTDQLEDAAAIYAVSGTMPIGCLTVKSAPRSNNHQSGIVNAEGVAEGAFS